MTPGDEVRLARHDVAVALRAHDEAAPRHVLEIMLKLLLTPRLKLEMLEQLGHVGGDIIRPAEQL